MGSVPLGAKWQIQCWIILGSMCEYKVYYSKNEPLVIDNYLTFLEIETQKTCKFYFIQAVVSQL